MAELLVIDITNIVISPTTVSASGTFTLSASVSENGITLQAEIQYSGEIYSGETNI